MGRRARWVSCAVAPPIAVRSAMVAFTSGIRSRVVSSSLRRSRGYHETSAAGCERVRPLATQRGIAKVMSTRHLRLLQRDAATAHSRPRTRWGAGGRRFKSSRSDHLPRCARKRPKREALGSSAGAAGAARAFSGESSRPTSDRPARDRFVARVAPRRETAKRGSPRPSRPGPPTRAPFGSGVPPGGSGGWNLRPPAGFANSRAGTIDAIPDRGRDQRKSTLPRVRTASRCSWSANRSPRRRDESPASETKPPSSQPAPEPTSSPSRAAVWPRTARRSRSRVRGSVRCTACRVRRFGIDAGCVAAAVA